MGGHSSLLLTFNWPKYREADSGKENRKFMSKNLKKILLEIHDQPMYDQKQRLEKTINAWMDGQSQMDDILIFGVRV